ncbi:glycoside hydrolase family 18 [Alistipes sp.]|uniref:glycoside hydrolase family 18 n=1 Tax=Alistipes sp. TaxID=1872444 RepID=UPI003A836364
MKRNIKIYSLSAVAAATLLLGSCSDWTDSESLEIRRPSLEAQNPALYAQYVAALRAYKEGDHKLTYVIMENEAGMAPQSQNQRLTSYPDSVDFICMTQPENLAAEYAAEMETVREKGTRVVYEIDYARLEEEWTALQAAQQPEETPSEEQSLSQAGQEDEAQSETPSDESQATFESFAAERLAELLACCDAYGFDGVTFTYEGPVLSGLTQTQVEALKSRLALLFEGLSEWRTVHPGKLLFFRGRPDNLPDGSFLGDCSYVIVTAESATSGEELSVELLRACVEGVPTDRLMIGVTTPATDDADEAGYFSQTDAAGDPLAAMVGAASWVVAPSEYGLLGVAINHASNDYYNLNLVYANIRRAIHIMNPTPEK